MKRVLFDSIAYLGNWIINGLAELSEISSLGVEKVFQIAIWILANSARLLLLALDKDRVNHAKQVFDQATMNRELEILGAISKVKEDAVNSRVWSNNHSEALNLLGNRLFNECDWEEDRIHDYMRRVVESIPGLGYMVGSDDEDDGIAIG